MLAKSRDVEYDLVIFVKKVCGKRGMMSRLEYRFENAMMLYF